MWLSGRFASSSWAATSWGTLSRPWAHARLASVGAVSKSNQFHKPNRKTRPRASFLHAAFCAGLDAGADRFFFLFHFDVNLLPFHADGHHSSRHDALLNDRARNRRKDLLLNEAAQRTRSILRVISVF